VWDYHVLLFVEAALGWEAWDLDSTLGLPVPAARYLAATFPGAAQVPEDLRPLFRLVEASDLERTFCSDRSHMRGPDGELTRPAPPWSPILVPGQPSNLMRFVDVEAEHVGTVTDLEGLCALVAPFR
jgi:protein N-terminal glutamine amidohydrolase